MALSENDIEQVLAEICRLIEAADKLGLETTVSLLEMARLDVITHISDAGEDPPNSKSRKPVPESVN